MIEIIKNINGKDCSLNLSDPDIIDVDQWYAVIDENYQPDKDLFILEKFNNDYPNYKVENISFLYNLVSRSLAMQEWLALANADFILNVECPEYFKEVITNEEFNKTSKNISDLNKLYAEKSNKENILAQEYRDKRKKLDEEYSVKFEKAKQDNYTKILAIRSDQLPLELQMMIENYTPSQENDINSKKRYAKELIIRYKLSLLKLCKNNEIEDINIYINDFSKL